jgi:hypothetical protein
MDSSKYFNRIQSSAGIFRTLFLSSLVSSDKAALFAVLKARAKDAARAKGNGFDASKPLRLAA